ncbi:hypothetical protein [Treponema sp.]|uniref:hypothetical protein n=1 Tax=Treponema sp. TaxID=166 RepID=UPI00257F633B|nr:hypothetical protein [Treponema sp.]MBE6353675.1 hypothetical protein [Treponema sp.]
MKKEVKGSFVNLDGQQFYKIENYDCMEDFFMTITSSCDVWNFCWSKGGITAGRRDCDHAVFPYYTADKVSDAKLVTGPATAIAVKESGSTVIWEPFGSLLSNNDFKDRNDSSITRNIYKNANGTKVWFEEINEKLGLAFRYGWTSSAKYGLVKSSIISNLSNKKVSLTILDGCRNILPASIDNALQNGSSVLLDAYKKTDLDQKTKLSMFTLSSVLTDKAEPSENLIANVSWFTTDDEVYLDPKNYEEFFENDGNVKSLTKETVLKGKRPSCFIAKTVELEAGKNESWHQVFDTFLTASRIAVLRKEISDKKSAAASLEKDIEDTDRLMTQYISEADGLQDTAKTMTCVHHRANVMFNIMRGGFFADSGKINVPDLLKFIGTRNQGELCAAEKALEEIKDSYSVSKEVILEKITAANNPQLSRLYLEYMPIIFSRRHGDPSRPWNRFNIKLNDDSGNPILNYEGNWRDIFQNWEALAMSYPAYIKNMAAKFLNAMTAEGFNPYRISRDGIDWECPEPNNPWAQFGYWGDHQVIYFEKLLELWEKTDSASLLSSLDESIYSSANIPYHLKSYAEICRDPRASISFQKELSDRLVKESRTYGTDAKLIRSINGEVSLISLTAKILQIVIAKTANLVPGGGIWMNTQRPEWNDANNALAGYGLSVVTLCYLNRMLSFLISMYSKTSIEKFTLPKVQYDCFTALSTLYKTTDADKAVKSDEERKCFTDKAGLLFEAERNAFYTEGYNEGFSEITKQQIIESLEAFQKMVKASIHANRRSDGLYHAYNTMKISESKMEIVYLQEMLEGQVAVLSSDLLSSDETLDLLKALKKSPIYEKRQNSYILYPNNTLPDFLDKNNIEEKETAGLEKFLEKTGSAILEKDINGTWHFNAEFHNARLMEDAFASLPSSKRPNAQEKEILLALYEKKFNHQNFTGRSGTFYAYEGLGSIYWHMVSKLLLAVQEAALKAYASNDKNAKALRDAYYDVRNGLSFNKTPELYGAFPSDPYSHTPYLQGAKQPGMTGQVKEEVLTRWGELGVSIADGKVSFKPQILDKEEFLEDKTLSFTWCGVNIKYILSSSAEITVNFTDGSSENIASDTLSEDITKLLFNRTGQIKNITVNVVM